MPVTVPSAWLMLASANARARPKSATFTDAVARDQDVLGFDVAVDDPVPVGVAEGGEHLGGHLDDLRGIQPPVVRASRLRRLWPRTYSMTMK